MTRPRSRGSSHVEHVDRAFAGAELGEAVADRTPGGHPVAVLSYGSWQRRFGARDDIVGKTLRLNGVVFNVIGVAPPKFIGVNAIVYRVKRGRELPCFFRLPKANGSLANVSNRPHARHLL